MADEELLKIRLLEQEAVIKKQQRLIEELEQQKTTSSNLSYLPPGDILQSITHLQVNCVNVFALLFVHVSRKIA